MKPVSSANFDDDVNSEPEDVETLRQLPVEERRKALRRLRNRESARRVRARRMAEMTSMEDLVTGLQEENAGLRTHVVQLQNTIQSLTVKVYEVTSKYEATVQENARLRGEVLASAAGQQATGHRVSLSGQVPLLQPNHMTSAVLSAPVAPLGLDVPSSALSSGGPATEQRKAFEEVIWLLQEHKRRAEVCKLQELSGSGSTMHHAGSSAGQQPHHLSGPAHSHSPSAITDPAPCRSESQVANAFDSEMHTARPGSQSADMNTLVNLKQEQSLLSAQQQQEQSQLLQQQQQQQQQLFAPKPELGAMMFGQSLQPPPFGSLLAHQQQQQQQHFSGSGNAGLLGLNACAGSTFNNPQLLGTQLNRSSMRQMALLSSGLSLSGPAHGPGAPSSNAMDRVDLPPAWSSGCNVPAAPGINMGLRHGLMDDLVMDFMDDLVLPQDL